LRAFAGEGPWCWSCRRSAGRRPPELPFNFREYDARIAKAGPQKTCEQVVAERMARPPDARW
jgi:hypothetical protein